MKSSITIKLLRWYDHNKRPLPWRVRRPDPYRVWLSEIMLQQTQVETVLPYYHRFLKNFPTLRKLAQAPLDEVLKFWSGLGYYSRARNLHQAAQVIFEKHSGVFPRTKREWMELPGIGEYTAGAIVSIAFGECHPVVDGNVIRVLTRVFTLKGDPKKAPLKEKLWELAESLVPQKRPGDFNQALMELGALVCSPKEPKCGACPLKKNCKARRQNKVGLYPTPKRKIATQKILLKISLIAKNKTFLLAKRNGKRHFQSMWEFPQVKPSQLGLKAKKEGGLQKISHSIMNRRIRAMPHLYRFQNGKPKSSARYVAYRWIRPETLKQFPTSSLNDKVLSIFYRHESQKDQDSKGNR